MHIATLRCQELKRTLQETKSFLGLPGGPAVAAGPRERTVVSTIDSDEDEGDDAYDLDESTDLEESWSEMSLKPR